MHSKMFEMIHTIRNNISCKIFSFNKRDWIFTGDHEDKADIYQIPYKNMVKYMFQMPTDADFEMLYGNLKAQETINSGQHLFY